MPLLDLLDGMTFGAGIDLAGQLRDTAINGSLPETPQEAVEVTSYLTFVESQADQDRALGLSTDVSAAVGLFGGSAKFDLSQELLVDKYSTHLVLRSVVVIASLQMRDMTFVADANRLLDQNKVDEFRARDGDYFIDGLQFGGQLCAILQITGRDQREQDEIVATLRASEFLGSVTAETQDQLDDLLRRVTQNRQTKLLHRQLGGRQVASIQPDQLVAHTLQFVRDVNAGLSEPFFASAQTYATLSHPADPKFVDVSAAGETLERLTRVRADAMTRFASFLFVRAHPEQFVIPPAMNLNDVVGRFFDAISSLVDAASFCADNPGQADEAMRRVAGVNIPPDALPRRINLEQPLPSIDGVWISDDRNFSVPQLDMRRTGPGSADVAVTVVGDGNAPSVRTTTAVLDAATNSFKTPFVFLQHNHQPGTVFGVNVYGSIAISNAISNNRTLVTMTIVRHDQPSGQQHPPVIVTSNFTRR